MRSTGAPFTTEEVKRKFLARTEPPPPARLEAPSETSSEETESEEEEEESDEPSSKKSEEARSDIGALLARSAHARDPTQSEEPPVGRSRFGGGAAPSGGRFASGGRYTSRFLNKSKSSAALAADDPEPPPRYPEEPEAPTGRSRYMALKERRQRLARSRSTQQFGDEEEPEAPPPISPSAYLAARGYPPSQSQSAHEGATEKDGAALSSWARYLKSKYGGRGGAKEKEGGAAAPSAAARRLSLGLPLRPSSELASSDDDQKNSRGSPTTHTVATAAAAGKLERPNHCSPPLKQRHWRRRALKRGGWAWPGLDLANGDSER